MNLQNAKTALNEYCQTYKLKPVWINEPSGGKGGVGMPWICSLQIPTPDGEVLHFQAEAQTKKAAEQLCAEQCCNHFRPLGLLAGVRDYTKPEEYSGVPGRRDRPPPDAQLLLGAQEQYSVDPFSSVDPFGAPQPHPQPVAKRPRLHAIVPSAYKQNISVNEPFAMMNMAQATPGPGNAPMFQSAYQQRQFMKQQQEQHRLQQLQQQQQQQDEDPSIGETYGYTVGVARAQLNLYLQNRHLPTEIPVIGDAQGPFTAYMEVQCQRGGSVRQEVAGSTKKEVTNQIAFRMCIKLCEAGEMPNFRTKAQSLQEGLAPCAAGVKPDVLRRLDGCLEGLGFGEILRAGKASPTTTLQPELDAGPWATQSDAREITWAPPEWGQSACYHKPGQDSEVWDQEDKVAQDLHEQEQLKLLDPRLQAQRVQRQQLPISFMAEEIMDSIEQFPVNLISGSTGCGKTTQVPQLLLERAIQRGNATRTNIICTQPRRIAAITVAERVASERGEPIGQSVGYTVRFAQNPPRSHASVCYMTTGMLLRRLASSGLRGVSHLIVDEVHERDLDSDFLLTIVRNLIRSAPQLRLILMSATIDLAKWSKYFGEGFGNPIEIPGRLFPVKVHYIDEAVQLTGVQPMMKQAHQRDDIPYDLIHGLIQRLVQVSSHGNAGAILVFLPGWDAIQEVQKLLERNGALKSRLQLHILHSQVPREEQQAAFKVAPPHLVKVILSTNIAESSVTISDVVYVIDSCRVKQLVPIQSPGGRTAYRLTNLLASKQNLIQRAGRAGRVQEGVCFRLCTRDAFQNLSEDLTPEMVRLPLHQVALTLKSLNLGSIAEFLAMCPDPPSHVSVTRAIEVLQDLKALDPQERITSLGLLISRLPIEPRMAFALLSACMLGLGEPMAILCALSAAPPLYENDIRRGKEAGAGGTKPIAQMMLSDHYDLLETFYTMSEMDPRQAMMVCQRDRLNYKTLLHVSEAVEQTLGILRNMGFGEKAIGPCWRWLSTIGTPHDSPENHQNWSALTFLLGLGLEHFAVRRGLSRKVWLGPGKTSQVALSPGIPEVPPEDPAYPIFLFAELRENEWNSTCRSVTTAGAVATLLGAAREVRYDFSKNAVLLDGWAPLKLGYETALRLGAARTALRACLLSMAKDPASMETSSQVAEFGQVMRELCTPHPPEFGHT